MHFRNKNRGFVEPILVAFVLLALVAGGYWFYTTRTRGTTSPPSNKQTNIAKASRDRIVFNSNRDRGHIDIWLMDPDGKNLVQLTKDQGNNLGPQWNGEKSKIIFSSDRDGGNYALYIMNADGMEQKRLTNVTDEEIWPSITRDTQFAFFARGPKGGKHDIWRKNLATGQEINLTRTTDADELETFANPDNSRIVFTSDRGKNGVYNCYVSDLDGQSVVQYTFDTKLTHDHCTFNTKGNKISFARENPNNKEEWALYAKPFDKNLSGNELVAFAKTAKDEFLVHSHPNVENDCPKWNDSDTAFVFEESTDFDKVGDIYIYDITTHKATNLTNSPDILDLHPVW